MKPAFTPEKLVTSKQPLLARFYDAGLTTAGGEVDPLNPPYFRISRELMGRVIHTLREEYISDDENVRMSAEFKEHMKVVLGPLETTLANSATRLEEHHVANSATRLEEHHVASMQQHEKLVKDAHDHLVEASEKFKAALTQQLHVMQKHNDRHVVMVEATTDLATTTRKQFSNIIFGEDTSKEARSSRKTYAESLLEKVDADFKKSQAEWIEEREALYEKIKQKEEENKKLLDQISDVGVKNYRRKQQKEEENKKLLDQISDVGVTNYRRKQERAQERAVASRIAEENVALHKAAQLTDEVVKKAEKLTADAVKIAVENARKSDKTPGLTRSTVRRSQGQRCIRAGKPESQAKEGK
jgi:hypothetical protein